jgi:hypothetical protein
MIEKMASGHLSIKLAQNVAAEDFPSLARNGQLN